MTLHILLLRYAVFAVLAAMLNLAIQRLILVVNSTTLGLAAAIGTGTIVGLIVKYLLDKRCIFYDADASDWAHARKFTLYTFAGLLTTCIFWGAETAFWLIWQTDAMRELGAVIGLTIGYVIKYNLDRRFVFTDLQLSHGSTQ